MFWLIPAMLTVVIWATAALWPKPKPTGHMFDFGPALAVLFAGTIALIATLVVWLIFFMVF